HDDEWQALEAGAEREQRTGAHQRVDVVAKAGQAHGALQAERRNLPFDVAPQLAFADPQRLHVRQRTTQRGDRAHEGERILLRHERANADDERRVRHNAERLENDSRRAGHVAAHFHSTRHDVDRDAYHASLGQHIGRGARHGDHGMGPGVLPARAGVRARRARQVPCDDQSRPCTKCRERSEAQGVRSLSMHDVDLLALDEAAQSERRDEARLRARLNLHDAQAGVFRPRSERVTGTGGNDAFMSPPRELLRQEQRLTLATAPAAFGVDLEDSQGHRTTSSAPARSRKAHDAPARILIVALANLGDLVFASSLAPPLAAAFPSAAIDLWCKRYTAAVGALLPHVRSVIAADPFWAVAPGHARPPLGPMLRSIGLVRRNRYDIALVTDAPWRTAAAVAAAGIPRRIGLARHLNSLFLTQVLPAEDVGRPVVRELARLAAAAGAPSQNPHYVLDRARIPASDRAAVAQLPAQFVALHPFASTRARCVPLAVWTQVAFALQARGISVLWVGRAPELDELRRSSTHPRGYYVDQFEGGALGASAAALSRASAFIGHDSGPLHVAAALGVPVVGVFAPGQPERTFPQATGPWRMISRPSPDGIDAAAMLHELDALQPITSPR